MKVVIPEGLNEIAISQYSKWKRVVLDNPDDDTVQAIMMVSIFCNLDFEQVMSLPRKEFIEIVEHLSRVLDQRPELVRTFKMGGVNYGLIPDIENASMGEYADADMLFGDDDKIPLLMSILYRPITRKAGEFYEIEPYKPDEKKAELFADVKMDIVIGAMLFFYKLNNELCKHLIHCLPQKMTQVELEDFMKDGDGIIHLCDLAEKSDASLTQLEESLFLNVSRFYRT
jgi:hypothetical protein